MSTNTESKFLAKRIQWRKQRIRIEEGIPLNHALIISRARRRLQCSNS